ncbi:hypothetical protein FISHEDRAFT_59622 [Fistulina hepatica ATCC 64428]|uniref:Uncharacterized protein n=1 Tax=Fistulina hepatica ATCC 64428 TaxID=1128425 RepID=A0A0D7A9L0_9AGAR|nr:hypothetical protein FISHEDRAFT_59622 [Fistulina hepatica ATCC 64428]
MSSSENSGSNSALTNTTPALMFYIIASVAIGGGLLMLVMRIILRRRHTRNGRTVRDDPGDPESLAALDPPKLWDVYAYPHKQQQQTHNASDSAIQPLSLRYLMGGGLTEKALAQDNDSTHSSNRSTQTSRVHFEVAEKPIMAELGIVVEMPRQDSNTCREFVLGTAATSIVT